MTDKVKEGILKSEFDKDEYGDLPYPKSLSVCATLAAMDEYSEIVACDFLKWYAVKMIVFIEYLKEVKPIVTSNEIEEKLADFEGKPIKDLFQLFIQSKQ